VRKQLVQLLKQHKRLQVSQVPQRYREWFGRELEYDVGLSDFLRRLFPVGVDKEVHMYSEPSTTHWIATIPLLPPPPVEEGVRRFCGKVTLRQRGFAILNKDVYVWDRLLAEKGRDSQEGDSLIVDAVWQERGRNKWKAIRVIDEAHSEAPHVRAEGQQLREPTSHATGRDSRGTGTVQHAPNEHHPRSAQESDVKRQIVQLMKKHRRLQGRSVPCAFLEMFGYDLDYRNTLSHFLCQLFPEGENKEVRVYKVGTTLWIEATQPNARPSVLERLQPRPSDAVGTSQDAIYTPQHRQREEAFDSAASQSVQVTVRLDSNRGTGEAQGGRSVALKRRFLWPDQK